MGGFGGGGGASGAVGPGSPSSPLLSQIFGTRFVIHEHGADAGLAEFVNDPNNPGSFAGLPQRLQQLFDPLRRTGLESNLLEQVLGQGSNLPQSLALSQGLADISALNAAEGAQTGFFSDPTPLFNEAVRRFNADVLPQIAETTGLGLQSSGFLNQGRLAASDLLGRAAESGVFLGNEAANRRALLTPVAQQTAAGRLALPINFTGDVLGLGQQIRNEQFQTEIGRPLAAFQNLSGVANQQPFFATQPNNTDRTSDLIGALGSALPFAIGAFGGV